MTTKSERITDSVDGLLGQVANEFFERLAAGEQPNIEEYAERHPEIADLIREIFPALDFVRDSAAHHAAPQPSGDGIDLSRSQELGDFRILREVGRGGMGVVYEAEQLSMGRHVALKVLPFAAMIDHKALQRFQNEVRAAATLDHDHITAIYSVGEERGVHYYAMQLVRGQSLAAVIHELADSDLQTPLPGSALSDVIISLGETSPADPHEPTVTLNTAEVSTKERSAVRTGASPAYYQSIARLGVQAAQALQHAHENGIVHRDIKPGNLMLDTSGKLWLTDFGLARLEADAGVTMTGDIVGTLRYMSPEQALAKRVIVDHRADIYSLGATLYELLTLQPAFDAEDRAELLRKIAFEEPRPLRQIDPGIPRELETIVQCALSKNPDERYDSAEALAADLQAFLENRSIQARRPTMLQRATKWSQRHKPLVTAAVLILLLSTIGLAVSNYLIADQQQQTQIALEQMRKQRDEADRQRKEAATQRNEAERQRAVADENFQRARQTVDEYLTRVSEDVLLNKPSLQPLRKDLLELALKYYQEFVAERGDDPELRKELADAYARVGNISTRIGTKHDALSAHRQALNLRKQLVDLHPRKLDYQLALLYSETRVADNLRDIGETDEAAAHYRKAIAIGESLVKQRPASPEYLYGLSTTYNNFAQSHNSGEIEQKMSLYRQARDILASLVARHPDEPNYQQLLAMSINNLAVNNNHLGRTDDAIRLYGEAIEIVEPLVEQHLDVLDYSRLAVGINRNIYGLHVMLGNNDKAKRSINKALQISKVFAEQNPDVSDCQYQLAQTYTNLARFHMRLGESDEAFLALHKAIEGLETLVKKDTEVPLYQTALSNAYMSLAGAYHRQGKSEAIALLEQVIEIRERLVEQHPDIPQYQMALSNAYSNSALAHLRQGRAEKVAARCRLALEIRERPEIRKRLGSSDSLYLMLGLAEQMAGNKQQANAAFETVVRRIEAIPEASRKPDDWGHLGQAFYRLQRWEESRDALETVIELRKNTSPTTKSGPRWWYFIMVLHRLGEKEQAREYYQQLSAELDATATPTPQQVLLRAEAAELLGIEDTPAE